MHYTLLLTNAEPEPGQVSDEAIAQMQQAMADYTAALHAAGVLVGADILAPQSNTVTVTRRDGDLRSRTARSPTPAKRSPGFSCSTCPTSTPPSRGPKSVRPPSTP